MSIWMEAADDMYEEALEHMDVQRKRLEEAERRENVLKHKYRILHELYEEREKQNSILNICVAGAAFCLHQIPNMGSDDDDDDGMEGHISPVREGEPHGPNPHDNGEEVLQGLPPSPPPLYPIHSDDEAEEMHSAMDISEPSQEPEILRPNRVFHTNDLNTAPVWTESPEEEEDPEERGFETQEHLSIHADDQENNEDPYSCSAPNITASTSASSHEFSHFAPASLFTNPTEGSGGWLDK
ncbi:hypothetical protein DAI22_09g001400 [Oryza sativa Japonica Group]|nr:hypothetical protein DAI22_09g001400 [Oryza sativa Japonica Group]